jgi:hypothetical protein
MLDLDFAVAGALVRQRRREINVDPSLQRACHLALELDRELGAASPRERVRAFARVRRRAARLDIAKAVEFALDAALTRDRPYDRRRARDLATVIARTCNDLPPRLRARDRALAAGRAQKAAEVMARARDDALIQARDLALAFANNLKRPWEQRGLARLLGLLACLFPRSQRLQFIEEHYANLAHASLLEAWAYLINLLPALPKIAWVSRIEARGQAKKSPGEHSQQMGCNEDADVSPSLPSSDVKIVTRPPTQPHTIPWWSTPITIHEQPTRPTRQLRKDPACQWS